MNRLSLPSLSVEPSFAALFTGPGVLILGRVFGIIGALVTFIIQEGPDSILLPLDVPRLLRGTRDGSCGRGCG